ncbi:hypothetical protein K438DRAFT_1770863 [Mycena galopus ATCC 62051]|nr:hypothetical protein K438DRAFT_1770863 [Mycena galopus ATCC 62051]
MDLRWRDVDRVVNVAGRNRYGNVYAPRGKGDQERKGKRKEKGAKKRGGRDKKETTYADLRRRDSASARSLKSDAERGEKESERPKGSSERKRTRTRISVDAGHGRNWERDKRGKERRRKTRNDARTRKPEGPVRLDGDGELSGAGGICGAAYCKAKTNEGRRARTARERVHACGLSDGGASKSEALQDEAQQRPCTSVSGRG